MGVVKRPPPCQIGRSPLQIPFLGRTENRVKFCLIDKVELITPEKIVAYKQVSLAEEYLADHFPSFPVLPGVMMLEALTQAAGWVLHHRTKFACSMAVLKEAKNVRYGQFVAPGNKLKVEVEFVKETASGAIFKAAGFVDGQSALTAKLEISYFNLGQKHPPICGGGRQADREQ